MQFTRSWVEMYGTATFVNCSYGIIADHGTSATVFAKFFADLPAEASYPGLQGFSLSTGGFVSVQGPNTTVRAPTFVSATMSHFHGSNCHGIGNANASAIRSELSAFVQFVQSDFSGFYASMPVSLGNGFSGTVSSLGTFGMLM